MKLFAALVALASTFTQAAALGQSIDARLEAVRIDGGIAALFAPELPRRASMLPDGLVTAGSGAIRHAWLTHPTTRYDHGVIGDAIEAGGLAAETTAGKILSLELDERAVFEDRLARIVRLDGTDGLLVVKSYLTRGAALAFIEAGESGLKIAAEAPPIGISHRWLNPVGIADFDGDGRDEVAAVLTPHIGGLLTIYRREGSLLRQIHQAGGFSNHRIGARELGWSAVVDANGDGIADIVVPDTQRRHLRIVTFAGGRFGDLARIALPAELSSSFARASSGTDVFLALADGKTYRLGFNPH
jgi:hypothetical protein